MIAIFLITIKIILISLFCGYGIGSVFLSDNLKKSGLISISFWLGTVIIAVFGMIFSLAKIPMNQVAIPILIICMLIWIYGLLNKKVVFYFSKETLIVGGLTLVTIIFNLYPLIKIGYPTTISLGNLDPISYTTVADFFKTNNVFQGNELIPFKPYLWSVGDLVHHSYRWGSPMILSFFASILNVRSYQVFSILITIFFGFTYPIVYLLAKTLSKSKSNWLSWTIFLTYAINSTLLYMLYNVFFAQIIFAGIFVLLLILLVKYFTDANKNNFGFNSYDFLIGLTLSGLIVVYPEGISFVFLGWLIFALFSLFTKERFFYLVSFMKIGLIALLINPMSVKTAIDWNLGLFLNTIKVTWIGWEKIRHALPLEILGFYNLYYYRDLPKLLDLFFGLLIIAIWLFGFFRLKKKLLIGSHIFVFFTFFVIYRFIFPNFFTYHKAITYSLFFYSVLFAIGLEFIFTFIKNKIIILLIVLCLTFLSFRSAWRTVSQLYYHARVVDVSLISLEKLNENKTIDKPFYTSDVFLGEYDLWKRLWREYFLTDKDIVSLQNLTQDYVKKEEIPYVLAEKNSLSYDNKTIKYNKIIWKNEYYLLGEIKLIK
ncbi:hypothetical protein COY87_05060 [Candidatus Roizmanbacteria bacterium CG_4_10_14_0_8_um_filter_33_9]|uniref:Glycosyltransferase RgtA/B/C/D-like domain-containing protein n=1 Tax=Candidatus Roizmanbacteria bacterium CG_4_10_14_0_8_um_filter_33_9 TaxID=1974826 RepID=A0A2M7QH55_9BACT|nr:MAG: hypothetical protein COY87_05060 [Candidatus Roizmanbacteria bacterium CG_4_10_14_0_8_um_filter_33_9]